jgi:DNA-binding XRE family transcriptional regulator
MWWKTDARALIFPFGKMSMTNQAVQIRSMEQLGELVRAARRDSGADQATTAGLVGVGVRFLGDLERGKSNLRIGLVLRVLERLGLEVWVAPRGNRRALP